VGGSSKEHGESCLKLEGVGGGVGGGGWGRGWVGGVGGGEGGSTCSE
jgi:hypothetical protein